ncbi:hypothetical protein ACJ73_00687 [Blastomyces percursus]|uniref:Uncharacterized protein n=1 Tax=Blastomyces percursus TaxID=1658174 RepID=A0A1J9QHF5_9EURO|nr:hypothetical protein ACJ73_00687 [Blastomyces percursus]
MSSDHSLKNKNLPVAIVGAGVFELSSAIHLAQRGDSRMSPFSINSHIKRANTRLKMAVMPRALIYQDLTLEALKHGEEWNEYLTRGNDLLAGMSTDDRIYVNTGNLHVTDESVLTGFEKWSLENISQVGLGHTQYNLNHPEEVCGANREGRGHYIDAFRRGKDDKYRGLFDSIGGFVYADKA